MGPGRTLGMPGRTLWDPGDAWWDTSAFFNKLLIMPGGTWWDPVGPWGCLVGPDGTPGMPGGTYNQAAIYELGKHEITQKCVLDAHKALLKLCKDGTTCDIRWVRGHSGALGNELADEATKLGSKSNRGNTAIPTAVSTIKRKIREKINILWSREWMSNPDWCRQTKYFNKKVDKGEDKCSVEVWQGSNILDCEVPQWPCLLKETQR